jgi:hypothetical protein
MAVQTFTPLALVAKTGRVMWSARTKEMTPPSMAATGSHLIRPFSRIRGIGAGVSGERVWGSDCPRVDSIEAARKSRGWVWALEKRQELGEGS